MKPARDPGIQQLGPATRLLTCNGASDWNAVIQRERRWARAFPAVVGFVVFLVIAAVLCLEIRTKDSTAAANVGGALTGGNSRSTSPH